MECHKGHTRSLLFLIYINDFSNASKVINFLMYADDTTLYCCLEDINSDNKEQILNNKLQRVHSWLNMLNMLYVRKNEIYEISEI